MTFKIFLLMVCIGHTCLTITILYCLRRIYHIDKKIYAAEKRQKQYREMLKELKVSDDFF
jgi:hypothetical protein